MTIRDAIREAAERFQLHRISNPRMCAEVLLAHIVGCDRTYLYTHDDQEIGEAQYQRLEEDIYERISGVPVQYIVGHQEFYGRDFNVNPSVLIPRPETEFIIEAVLEMKPSAGCRIIDVGSGSGCIGVTLALEIPGSRVFATDISEAALRVARDNAVKLNAPVSFACVDLLDAVGGVFEVVVSNPPYVGREELDRLQREVREHEPHVALFAPGETLDMYARLIQDAARVLTPAGRLIMEIGFGMEQSILALFDDTWECLPTKADLQGIPRTVIAKRRE